STGPSIPRPPSPRFGGTEARALVSLGHRLYAGIGYWSDSRKDDPALPGAQLLAKASAGGHWEYVLAPQWEATVPGTSRKRFFAVGALAGVSFIRDASGAPLPKAASVLIASVW